MALVGDIRTAHRRPCLLRAQVESTVDAHKTKQLQPAVRESTGSGDSQSGIPQGPDERTLTLDMQAPLGTGLHKGGGGFGHIERKLSRAETLASCQALGVDFRTANENMLTRRRLCSPENRERTKSEILQCVPLSGRGADITMLGGRRNLVAPEPDRDPAVLPNQAKMELGGISIDHQFRRRHVSAPPKSGDCHINEDFEHSLRAQGYATLLCRPEGMGKRGRPQRARSQRSLQPPDEKDEQESCELSTSGVGRERVNSSDAKAPPLDTHQLIANLREATRNTPSEKAWDQLLSALEESPQLFSPKAQEALRSLPVEAVQGVLANKVTATLAAMTGGTAPMSPRPSPCSKGRSLESPRKLSGQASFGLQCRAASEASLMSATTVDTDGRLNGRTSSESSMTVGGSFSISAGTTSVGACSANCSGVSQRRAPRRSQCQAQPHREEEQWKARRRAAWVA